jgi:hypothetical protein
METTSTGTSSYSHTEQSVAHELSLKQISQVFLQNWLLFVLMFILISSASIVFYVYKIPYVGQASITVNDSQNSSLQSFASQFFGLSKIVNEGRRNNSPLLKHAEYLKTSDFFEGLVKDIKKAGESKNLTIPELQGFRQFQNQVPENSVISFLDQSSKIKVDSDFELKVSYTAPTKELALFLTNTALHTTLNTLKQREFSDILKVENFIKEQQASAEKNMMLYNKQLADFQNKPENLISLSSKEKVGEYLSELMVRKNELKMKIAENQRTIHFLSQGQSASRESQLYGNAGRVQALVLENQMHSSNLVQLQATVDRVTTMAKAIPVASQIFEDLKKKSEIEFQKYKSLSEALSKAEVQKLSIESRFEVLEKAQFDKVKPQVSLFVLLLVSLVLSQILSCLIIYIGYIWDSNTVTAQSSRNVVILDGHSLDPRVIIEDSKIRFRLKDSRFEESSQNEEDATSKRLTFRLFNKRSANGEENEF